jgi:phosphoribosylaminoimidazole (AIR) synthetase
MVAVVAAERAQSTVDALRGAGETAWVAGEIVSGERKVVLA